MYVPSSPPVGGTSQEYVVWLMQELQQLASILSLLEDGVFLRERTAPPAKPRERQIAFADGVNWNPGSGKGLYCYYNSAWHFLG